MAVGDNYLGLGNNVRLGLSRPDANLRTTALKMQLGIRPSERELRRYAQRQGVEQEILNRQTTGIYGTGSMQDEGLSGLYGLGSPKTDMRMGMLAADYGGIDNYRAVADAQTDFAIAKSNLMQSNANVADALNAEKLRKYQYDADRMQSLADWQTSKALSAQAEANVADALNAEKLKKSQYDASRMQKLADWQAARAVSAQANADVADDIAREKANAAKFDARIKQSNADVAEQTQDAKIKEAQNKAIASQNKNLVEKNDIVNEYIGGVIPKYLDAPTGNVSPIGLTLGLGGNNRKINPDWTYYNFFKKQGMFDAIKTPADLAEAESQGIIPPEMARAFERLRFGGGDNTQGVMPNKQDTKNKAKNIF